MSENTLIALLSIGVTVLVPIVGWIAARVWRNGERIAALEGRVHYLLDEVGRSHTEGMRWRVHTLENDDLGRKLPR